MKDVSLQVHAGEILGVAGVDGNGQTELVEAIAGLRTPKAGHIRIGGVDVTSAERAGPPRREASGTSRRTGCAAA